MKHRGVKFGVEVALAGMFLFLTGCATGPYYGRLSTFKGGYKDTLLSPGVYEVAFAQGNISSYDAKVGALYRASEIAYQNHCQYFQVTKGTDHSQNFGISGSTNYHVHHGTVIINIKLANQMGTQAVGPIGIPKWVDAYYFLDHNPVPEFKERYTITDRKADARKGIHSWQERVEQKQNE